MLIKYRIPCGLSVLWNLLGAAQSLLCPCHVSEEVGSSLWSLVWGQRLFLALVLPCAGLKPVVWQTDKSRWAGKLPPGKCFYPSWQAAVSVHFWEPHVHLLLVKAPLSCPFWPRFRWQTQAGADGPGAVALHPWCGCALPCLPRNPTATNPTFLPAYPWSTFLNSLSSLAVFPDGCLLFFFFLFHFLLGWWQQGWVKITLGLIMVWSCKTGFLKVFERWAVLSHSLSYVFPCEYFSFYML